MQKINTRFLITIVSLFLFLSLAVIYSVSVGVSDIPFNISIDILAKKIFNIDLTGNFENIIEQKYIDIIWSIRFPRVLISIFAGAGLALTGLIMQSTIQNPLADPYVLGISSGASLGATICVLFGFSNVLFGNGLEIFAFLGALLSAFIVMYLSSLGGKISSVKLVLSGMIINTLAISISNFIVYMANDAEGIKTITFWSMGSLAGSNFSDIMIVFVSVTIAFIYFMLNARTLNTLIVGDSSAMTLGVDVNKIRIKYIIITALLTGVLVANFGIIGFVGLVVPHIVRGIVGSNHTKLIPITVISGAIFLLVADTIARTIISNTEIPIGIVTSLVGAPIFIYILVKKEYSF